ncbi:ArsR/SmtB family transcription factor [Salinarimonas chemoclinalis]|uniref:ArsR/SmtB family transcription factor n=1 Tax=Salinarimonas chemoclinalis TaxID=3241599 RepID=UPI0035562FD6
MTTDEITTDEITTDEIATGKIDEYRLEQLKSLSSDVRLQIMDWLREPSVHFSDQVTGDPDEMGVCVSLVAKKLGFSQPTTSRHLQLLLRAGLVKVNRYHSWSFYYRDEAEIARFRRWISTI